MIALTKFLSSLEEALGWPYRSPGSTARDASSGIDCSGMLVRAYKLQGKRLFHGSNGIWRTALSEKGRLTDAAQLRPGYVVFKWRKDGAPSRYKDGEGNFHHVGVVLSVSPLRIIHASSVRGCVVIDDTISGWTHFGRLKAVAFEEAPGMLSVTSENGAPVHLRRKPNRRAALVDTIPCGTAAECLGEQGEWMRIRVGKKTGWMMKRFLRGM